MASDQGLKTVKGSCHCGNIKYEIRLNPDKLEANRCNCTFCRKPGLTNFHVKDPENNFKLISPADKSGLGNYQPNTKSVDKWFCKDCGVHVYMAGEYEYQGQKIPLFSVNFQTIDQPQDGIDVSKTKISYWDGLNNNFHLGLKDSPYPGGLP